MMQARVKITGDEEFRRRMQRAVEILNEAVPEAVLKLSFQAVNLTKEKYLTDPGRQYANRWYRRPDGTRYRPVLNYPRPKIGVLTDRLRASYGADTRDGIREIYQSGWKMRIGTKVEYARAVAQRKYDFAKAGLEDAERQYLDRYINEILRRVINA